MDPLPYEATCLLTSSLVLAVGFARRSPTLVMAGACSCAMRGERCLARGRCGDVSASHPRLLALDQIAALAAYAAVALHGTPTEIAPSTLALALFALAAARAPFDPRARALQAAAHAITAAAMLLHTPRRGVCAPHRSTMHWRDSIS